MIHVDSGKKKQLYDFSGKRVWSKKRQGEIISRGPKLENKLFSYKILKNSLDIITVDYHCFNSYPAQDGILFPQISFQHLPKSNFDVGNEVENFFSNTLPLGIFSLFRHGINSNACLGERESKPKSGRHNLSNGCKVEFPIRILLLIIQCTDLSLGAPWSQKGHPKISQGPPLALLLFLQKVQK